jgi:prepilin-type N-terminal cleavage/methylation domain-containing protein
MQIRSSNPRSRQGFTLVEIAVAMAVLLLIVVACFSAITFSRISALRAKEQAIALDFLTHYLETVRGLPFAEVRPNRSINPLFDGNHGAPKIRLPATADFVTVDTADFRTFHPDLAWLTPRRPELSVAMDLGPDPATPQVVHLSATLRWDAPLGQGNRQSLRLDSIRHRDF